MARPRARRRPRRPLFRHVPLFQLPTEHRHKIMETLSAIRGEVTAMRSRPDAPAKITFDHLPPSAQDKIHSILPWFIEHFIWTTGGDPSREGPLAPFWPRQQPGRRGF